MQRQHRWWWLALIAFMSVTLAIDLIDVQHLSAAADLLMAVNAIGLVLILGTVFLNWFQPRRT